MELYEHQTTTPHMLAFADLPFAPDYFRDTLRVYYGAKELFVEEEISQGMFTILHAFLIPRNRQKIYAG